MTRYDEIAIKVIGNNGPVEPSYQVVALLYELQDMHFNLVHFNKSASIDIHSLPMSSAERDHMKSLLGSGEVTATVNALGPTKVVETEIPGVWWITHCNADDEIMTESIEVTQLPAILKTQQQDLLHAIDIFKSKTGELILDS